MQYNSILKDITPDRDALLRKAELVLNKIQKNADTLKIDVEVMMGGSIAKGTVLKGKIDCDVFVRFNYEKYKHKDLSKLLKRIIAPFTPERVHGSRDYYWIQRGGITYEIVPVLHITDPSKALNVTDMSPLHVAWVLDRLKRTKVQKDIRLAKQFCKACGVYGAESYIGGFSGHVIDILVIHYGGFEKLLKAATRWNGKSGDAGKVIVDPDKNYASKEKALSALNKAKTQSPLILIDPVLPERNAAAALEQEPFERFKACAKQFLKKPSKTAFTIKKTSLTDIKKRAKGKKLIVLDAVAKKNKPDIVGAKLRKVYEYLNKQLSLHDFQVIDSDWLYDKKQSAMLWYIIPKQPLSAEFIRKGPPTRETSRVESFKKKYGSVTLKNGVYYARATRKFTSAIAFLKELCKEKYVKEKARVKIRS